jgi:signal peptidase I
MKRCRTVARYLPGLLCFLLLGVAGTAFARPCTEKAFTVRGVSMVPLFRNGEDIHAVMGGRDCLGTLEKGDIVLFENGGHDVPLIKRIHAAPGDRFAVEDGAILVNGEPAVNSRGQPYHIDARRARMLGLYIRDYNGVIPPDTFLVLGENVSGTGDSTRYGLVHISDIVGKVIWPEPGERGAPE